MVDIAKNSPFCGSILKIWYEDDWDTFMTKDLIVEEVTLYRKSPMRYIQEQIGIR